MPRAVAVGKLTDAEIRAELSKTELSEARYKALKNEWQRRQTKAEKATKAAAKPAKPAARPKAIPRTPGTKKAGVPSWYKSRKTRPLPRKPEYSQLRRDALRAQTAAASGRSRTTTTDEHGNSITVESRTEYTAKTAAEVARARARRYPGVVGADARVLAIDTEISRIKRRSVTNNLSRQELDRLAQLQRDRSGALAKAREKYQGAYQIELKRAQKEKRAEPKAPPKRPKKIKHVASQKEVVHHTAYETLIERQREYAKNPTPANEKRVRDAWAVLHHAQDQLGMKRRTGG